MAQLIEKSDKGVIDSQLIPDEVEALREAGVDVEELDDEGNGEGEGSSDGSDSGEEPEEQESGSGGGSEPQEGEESSDGDQSGSGEANEESDEKSDEKSDGGSEFDNSGLSSEDVEQLEAESDMVGEKEDMVDSQELDRQVRGAEIAGAGEGDIKLCNFNVDDYDSEWEKIAARYANQLGGVLTDHFRQERKTRTKQNLSSGSFDSRKMISADRGSPRVFKKDTNPGNKKYHAVIALDDSGSMGYDCTRNKEANIATAMIVQALEKVGIDVTVYRFARNIRLVKSPTQSYEETKDKILSKQTNGGTSLLPLVKQLGEISREYADETFFICLTDGEPALKHDVKDEIMSTNMSSICIQIDGDDDFFRGAYDGWVTVEGGDSIPSKASAAFRRVML